MSLTTFDPLTGVVSGRDIRSLPQIAARARRLLRKRTSAQILAAQVVAVDWLNDYLEVTFDEEKTRLEQQAHRGDSHALEFFETTIEYEDDQDEHGIVHIGSFKSHMIDNMDILHQGNASEIEVLVQCIDAEMMDSPRFPDGTEAEFLAAFALREVSLALDAISRFHDETDCEADNLAGALHHATERYIAVARRAKTTTPPLSFDLQEAIDRSIDAMHAVTCAEAAISMVWFKDQMIQKANHAVASALNEENRKQTEGRKELSGRLLEKRHAKNRETKRIVLEQWEMDPSAFPSAASAAEHFTKWLAEEKETKVTYITVRDWILARAKELGIKWR